MQMYFFATGAAAAAQRKKRNNTAAQTAFTPRLSLTAALRKQRNFHGLHLDETEA